jgi:hypothetical protein
MRYLGIATLIVIGLLVLLTKLPRESAGSNGDVRYSSSSATPGPAQNADRPAAPPGPVSGDAPWALSALPECFHQVSQRSGTPEFARAEFPRGARLVAPGLRLRVADCTLDVARDSAVVVRGENRFVVPPAARFFVAGSHVVLDRTAGGRVEVRVYAVRGQPEPRFEPAAAGQPLQPRGQSHS